MKHKISLIMPCHNEGGEIYRNLHETVKTMNELREYNIDYEIILVDDGSTDNTLKEAKLVKSNKIRLVSYKPNKGKGYAIKYGFQYAKGDLVTFVDSDLEIHPKQLLRFASYIYEQNADIVIGSKSHPDSIVSYPLKRKILSKAYHVFVNILFGLHVGDTQSGLKLMRYTCAEKIIPKVVVKRYAFDLELLVVAKKLGFKIKEAPIEVRFNFNKKGIGFKSVWPIFQDTLGIAYRKYILQYYDRKGELPKVKKSFFGLFSW
ncbi:MAG: glycosyltransferase [Nanoarchaeota archaeon]